MIIHKEDVRPAPLVPIFLPKHPDKILLNKGKNTINKYILLLS